jgi:hypothetical protein
MQTVGAMWELGSCFGKCNRKVCSQTLYFHEVAECMANFPLKRAGVFVSGSLKVDGIQVSLWGVACWTCMQTVGALRMLAKCSTRCHLNMWSLGSP